jgi:hypothetical protein
MFDVVYEAAPGQQASLHFDSPLTAIMWIKGTAQKGPLTILEIKEGRIGSTTHSRTAQNY